MRDRSSLVKRKPADGLDPEGRNVLFDLWLVARAATGVLDAAIASSGLTADEFGVYSVLVGFDSMTPTELARWVSAPPTTVSSYIKRIEQRGHLRRMRNPDDGRSYVIALTPAGRKAHQAAGEAFLPVLADVVAALGAREKSVRNALELLRKACATESE